MADAPSGSPAAATPSVIAIIRRAPFGGTAIRTMSRCTCTPSQMISAAISSLVRIGPGHPGLAMVERRHPVEEMRRVPSAGGDGRARLLQRRT